MYPNRCLGLPPLPRNAHSSQQRIDQKAIYAHYEDTHYSNAALHPVAFQAHEWTNWANNAYSKDIFSKHE